MASQPVLLFIAAVSLLISPAISQLPRTCELQTTLNQTYAYCLDLHTLGAYLHWTYDPPSPARLYPTLDIAFLAPPAGPDGWVAWALNPTSSRMDGAQALIAFAGGAANGSLAVRTFNITSYTSIAESPIAYWVLSSRAEFSGGLMRIFATLVMPTGGPTELNIVYQVGGAVRNGVPAAHEMGEQNLNSRMTVSQDPGPTGERGRRIDPAGSGWKASAGGFGLYGGLVLLLVGVFLGF